MSSVCQSPIYLTHDFFNTATHVRGKVVAQHQYTKSQYPLVPFGPLAVARLTVVSDPSPTRPSRIQQYPSTSVGSIQSHGRQGAAIQTFGSSNRRQRLGYPLAEEVKQILGTVAPNAEFGHTTAMEVMYRDFGALGF